MPATDEAGRLSDVRMISYRTRGGNHPLMIRSDRCAAVPNSGPAWDARAASPRCELHGDSNAPLAG